MHKLELSPLQHTPLPQRRNNLGIKKKFRCGVARVKMNNILGLEECPEDVTAVTLKGT